MKTLWIVLILLAYLNPVIASDCLSWFLKSGLASKPEDCQLRCSITPVDMETFSCPLECENLCSKSLTDHFLNYVPRLTEGDKVIITKMPYEAYKVFIAKEKVDKITSQIFKNPGREDESDAFRHFVWSFLLAQELGPDKALLFLNAHEEDSTQSSPEKDMDIFNNKQGLDFYKSIKKSGQSLEIDKLEKEALARLKQKKLKVLKPRYSDNIPGGYYSQ